MSDSSRMKQNKILLFLKSLVGLVVSIFMEIVNTAIKGIKKFLNFVVVDHKYVYLGGSALFIFTALMSTRYFKPRGIALMISNYLLTPHIGVSSPPLSNAETLYSYLFSLPTMVLNVLFVIGAGFLVLSIIALITKLFKWNDYSNTWAKNPNVIRFSRYYSYYIGVLFTIVFIDAVILNLLAQITISTSYTKNPDDFLQSMIYMTFKGQKILLTGLDTTIRLALVGTAVGFVAACLLVFMRIQKIDKRDNDFVKFLKQIGLYFSKTYITVIRGTPMMVQALIIYYSGFGIAKDLMPNAPISEINMVWGFFTAGLITVSLNTTAYLAEVLRGSVEALDKGQNEAARSLGMTNWQAMMKVIFPQAVKNSVPAIGNEFIINIKDSSVLNVISVMDLMYATKTVVGMYFKELPVYLVTAMIYLVLTYFLTKLLNIVAKKLNMPANRGIPSSN